MRLEAEVGARFKVTNNTELGVLTIVKIGLRVDEFGDKGGELTLKAVDAHGRTRAMTPVSQFTSEHFELVD